MTKISKILGLGALVVALATGCDDLPTHPLPCGGYVSKEATFHFIGAEKVLNLSVESYIKSKGVEISDYNLIGVGECNIPDTCVYCSGKIPKNTEVLLNPKQNSNNNSSFMPVALVPKYICKGIQ